ncbi:MAG: FAD-binding oxidoreductase [Polaromonas sp.]|uniref:FAD-binding oxidoreductase n=1 Tax=Polaromonas sp. TaxID=1869339 RepID=UPI002730DCB0|nr:FAD-binding oxidoreductase [Polaromonas sp.]MDP2256167.1 FAD-binding oxidoreductase [Polaromonas sp.]MDP3709313.1 FAD-binding oxidoreductase [Polaromonas sp.]
MTPDRLAHDRRRAELAAAVRAGAAGSAAPLGLGKRNSNLFRDRHEGAKQRLDLSGFCHVLDIDTAGGWVDVEGLTTYEALVAQTLPQGVMPAVVPQLKTITVGGAAAGVGIEATSFRCGLVHDTLLELDVLLPGGEVVHCTPDNAHRDLFFGFANSYGTLGYALRLRLRTLPVKPYVRVEHVRHELPGRFFGDLVTHSQGSADFVDGVVFGPQQQVINRASFVDAAPWLSDYSFKHIYYRSLLDKPVDYLTVQDYIWRWDTDWFWCSKNLYAQHPLVRRLLGKNRLNSRTYTRVMRWNARWGLTRRLARWRGRFTESVIQDIDIPIASASEFLAFLLREIGILPIWICPVRGPAPGAQFALYPLVPDSLYVNFGFWDVVESAVAYETGHFNRLVEREVMRLGGIKSLYSDSFFTPDEFAQTYAMERYQVLKARYDPAGRMLGLYEKCVLRA